MEKTSKIVVIFLMLIIGGSLKAQVLWYADPDKSVTSVFYRFDTTGNTSGTYCVDGPNNKPTVTTPIDPVYGKFWRITKPALRKRAEFARVKDLIPQEGQTYYYGWRWRIASTPNVNAGIAVFQWKTDQGSVLNSSKQNYPFNITYNGTKLSLNAYGPAEPNWDQPGSIDKRKTVIWTGDVAEDTWVTFVIKIYVDKTYDSVNNRHNGYIEFWYNGVKQTLMNSNFQDYQVVLAESNTRAYHRTNDGVQVYPKWGSYGQSACEYETMTDYNDMRLTSTYEEAQPILSTEKFIKSNIDISPNPVGDTLHLLNLTNEGSEIKILDLSGKLLYSTKNRSGAKEIDIPVSKLPKGIYIIEISDNSNSITKKFVKK